MTTDSPEQHEQAARAAWLESLKEGDEVAVVNLVSESTRLKCVIRRIYSISPVQRQISVDGVGIRFDRRGRSYNSREMILRPVTDEVRAHVRRARLIAEIRNFDLHKAPTEILEKLREVQRSSSVGQTPYNPGQRFKECRGRLLAERELLSGKS